MNTNRTAGAVLLVAGVLLAGTSGLCSAAMLAESGPNAANSWDSGMGMLVLVFGGIPFLLGAMLILGGVLALRNARRQAERVAGGEEPK